MVIPAPSALQASRAIEETTAFPVFSAFQAKRVTLVFQGNLVLVAFQDPLAQLGVAQEEQGPLAHQALGVSQVQLGTLDKMDDLVNWAPGAFKAPQVDLVFLANPGGKDLLVSKARKEKKGCLGSRAFRGHTVLPAVLVLRVNQVPKACLAFHIPVQGVWMGPMAWMESVVQEEILDQRAREVLPEILLKVGLVRLVLWGQKEKRALMASMADLELLVSQDLKVNRVAAVQHAPQELKEKRENVALMDHLGHKEQEV